MSRPYPGAAFHAWFAKVMRGLWRRGDGRGYRLSVHVIQMLAESVRCNRSLCIVADDPWCSRRVWCVVGGRQVASNRCGETQAGCDCCVLVGELV